MKPTMPLQVKAAITPRPTFTRSRGALLQRKCACSGTPGLSGECEECRKKRLERKSTEHSSSDIQPSAVPSIVHEVLHSPGHPLDKETRDFFEPRFGHDFNHVRIYTHGSAPIPAKLPIGAPHDGFEQEAETVAESASSRPVASADARHDFSGVRIHTGAKAEKSAQVVGANAYTVGSQVVFGARQFAPTTNAGRRLLAHELTHVLQQTSEGQQSMAPQLMRQRSSGLVSSSGRRVYSYDRSNFQDRFDGEVDEENRRVTLIIGLAFEDYGGLEGKADRIAKFRVKAKELIEKTWSRAWALQSVCESSKYEAIVRVETNSGNPHQTVRIWKTPPGGARSKSTEWQQNDLEWQERPSAYQMDPSKPPSPQNVRPHTFYQVPATHEFGHLIGLDHILCVSEVDRCYGVTLEQKLDIMGVGSIISQGDYVPFVRIMERYGRDRLPTQCNRWKLVSPE
jgi:hypothetical protein